MKSIALLACFGVAAMSQASFELILAMDRGTGSNGKVHRYDGDSGTYLGSFASGWVGANSVMAMNQSANELAIGSGGFIRIFNYNTGELKRTLFTGGTLTTLTYTGGNNFSYTLGLSTGIFTINSVTGGATTISTATTGALVKHLVMNGSDIRYTDSSTNKAFRSTNGGSSFSSYNIPAPALTGGLAQGIASGNNFGDYYYTTTSFGGIYYDYGSGAGSLAFAGFSGTTGVGLAHGGANFILGAATAGGARFIKTDTYLNPGFQFDAPQIAAPGHIAVVVAPEPGSWVALGLSAAALLSRRRRKS